MCFDPSQMYGFSCRNREGWLFFQNFQNLHCSAVKCNTGAHFILSVPLIFAASGCHLHPSGPELCPPPICPQNQLGVRKVAWENKREDSDWEQSTEKWRELGSLRAAPVDAECLTLERQQRAGREMLSEVGGRRDNGSVIYVFKLFLLRQMMACWWAPLLMPPLGAGISSAPRGQMPSLPAARLRVNLKACCCCCFPPFLFWKKNFLMHDRY